MQGLVYKRSFSVLSKLTRAFWNTMTYGNSGAIPMKSLWKNKTELHDMARMQEVVSQVTPKPYVKDWSITVKKVKSQNNQWKQVETNPIETPYSRYHRRGRKRESQWNRR